MRSCSRTRSTPISAKPRAPPPPRAIPTRGGTSVIAGGALGCAHPHTASATVVITQKTRSRGERPVIMAPGMYPLSPAWADAGEADPTGLAEDSSGCRPHLGSGVSWVDPQGESHDPPVALQSLRRGQPLLRSYRCLHPVHGSANGEALSSVGHPQWKAAPADLRQARSLHPE